jgi:hypothetical protein
MVFPRQFLPAVATVISLGFLTIDYFFHHSHATLFFLYLWMALYFLYAMAVGICAVFAFKLAMARWSSQSATRSKSEVIGDWLVTTLVCCLAFSHQHIFLWTVFAVALSTLIWVHLAFDSP